MTSPDANLIRPHNIAAEQAVLGCIFQEGAAIVDQVELEPTQFFLDRHRMIFAAIRGLHGRGRAVTTNTVADELHELGQLDAAGGTARLALLEVEGLLSIPVNLPTYVGIVQREAARREAIAACRRAEEDLSHADRSKPAVPVLDVAQRLTDELAQQAIVVDHGARAEHLGDVLAGVRADLDRRERADLVPTPIAELNERLGGGTAPGEAIVVGGRPGMAKTAFATQWATHAAQFGHRVLVISREMKNPALGRRIFAQQAMVAATDLRKRDVDESGRRRMARALPRLSALPVYLADQARTFAQIQRLVRLYKPRLVIVDYLQLVRHPVGKQDRRLEVSAVSAGLKDIAQRQGCSVVAISALRRLGTDKAGNRLAPTIEDLKESGDIEADADVILLLWQPSAKSRDRELIFAKLREGEGGGAATLDWEPAYVRFTDVPVAVEPEPGDEPVPF